jgi:hypothetical protein
LVTSEIAFEFLSRSLDLVANGDVAMCAFFGLLLGMTGLLARYSVTSGNGVVLIMLLEFMLTDASDTSSNGCIAGSVAVAGFVTAESSGSSAEDSIALDVIVVLSVRVHIG